MKILLYICVEDGKKALTRFLNILWTSLSQILFLTLLNDNTLHYKVNTELRRASLAGAAGHVLRVMTRLLAVLMMWVCTQVCAHAEVYLEPDPVQPVYLEPDAVQPVYLEPDSPEADIAVVPVAESFQSGGARWRWVVPAPSLSIKTNLAGWALAWVNIEPELEFADNWSFNLPLYYSAWNYGHSYRKFRGISLMPGFRRYLTFPCDCCPIRFWIGAHGGIKWYNYAFRRTGDRYQDHDGNRPALGGGLDLGIRIAFKKGSPWSAEAGVGAGWYHLYYDVWRNGGCGEKLVERKQNKFMLDYLTLSICYTFKLGRRAGL